MLTFNPHKEMTDITLGFGTMQRLENTICLSGKPFMDQSGGKKQDVKCNPRNKYNITTLQNYKSSRLIFRIDLKRF